MLRFIFPKGLNIIRSYIVFLSVIGAIFKTRPNQHKRNSSNPFARSSGFLGLRAESEANETQKEKRRTLFLQEERMQKLLNLFPKEIPLVLFAGGTDAKIIKSISEGNTACSFCRRNGCKNH